MLIDIYVSLVEVDAPVNEFGTPGVDLNEALWIYLLPQFRELKTLTGEDIDLYNVADFSGENIEILKGKIEEGLNRIKGEEASVIVVDLGEEAGPRAVRKLLYDFHANEAGEALNQILALAAQASAEQKTVRFRGQ